MFNALVGAIDEIDVCFLGNGFDGKGGVGADECGDYVPVKRLIEMRKELG